MTKSIALFVLCVECEGIIFLPKDVEENEIVVCGDCGIDLEVLSLEPLIVHSAPITDEDWGE
jgi:alpha-aminoadipate/glutamate carrier protein LysW